MQATAIFVTHDQDEALFMGDRLGVFCRDVWSNRHTGTGFPRLAKRFIANSWGNSVLAR
jgi:ABC-type sugar transport system ATPase subunit